MQESVSNGTKNKRHYAWKLLKLKHSDPDEESLKNLQGARGWVRGVGTSTKGESIMKVSAKIVLLLVSLIFFVGISGEAQDCKKMFFSLNHDSESAINDLQQEVICLNEKLQSHDDDYLKIQNLKMDLDTATTAIKTLTLDLETMNRRIETLESSSCTLDHFSARPSSRRVTQPNPPANQPKPAVKKQKPAVSPSGASGGIR
jgi:hypothetical protein